MKETVRSLRAYFVVTAIFGLFFGVVRLGGIGPALLFLGAEGIDITPKIAVIWLLAGILIQTLVCLAFLYFARSLPRLLRDSPQQITRTLVASMITSVAVFPATAYLSRGIESGALLSVAVGLGISYYLFTQVKRLSAQLREDQRPSAVG